MLVQLTGVFVQEVFETKYTKNCLVPLYLYDSGNL